VIFKISKGFEALLSNPLTCSIKERALLFPARYIILWLCYDWII